MPFYRLQQTFQGVSGVPTDRYVNDFAIFWPTLPSPTEWTDILTVFTEFYDADQPGALGSIAGQFSQAVAQGPHVIKAYELETPPPHLPLASLSWSLTLAPAAVDDFPEEVAIVLSIHGDITAGTDTGPGPHLPARHRNRIYLGPWAASIGEFTLAGVRPTEFIADTILSAADGIRTGLAGIDPTGFWAIWSPTRADGEAVRGGHVDNAFDTQRRRGVEATSRRFFGNNP